MGKLIKNLAFFVIYIAVLSFVVIAGFKLITGKPLLYLPPPNFSDSYCFNDKMVFAKNKQADVLAIGSSMGLNDLDSKTVINNLKTNSYLNISSWGLSIKDIFLLAKMYTTIHKPSHIIMTSNFMDFQAAERNVNYSELKRYLTNNTVAIGPYFKHLNTNFQYSKKVKTVGNSYESLVYDEYGAALLDPNGFVINKNRWQGVDFSNLREEAYHYLDSISAFCKTENIKLVFFQTPIRYGIYKNIKKQEYLNHIARVEKSVLQRGHVFFNSNDRIWPDSLFVDPFHFNANGAKLFTEYCFAQIKQPL